MKIGDMVTILVGQCAGQSAEIVAIDWNEGLVQIKSSLGWTETKRIEFLRKG